MWTILWAKCINKQKKIFKNYERDRDLWKLRVSKLKKRESKSVVTFKEKLYKLKILFEILKNFSMSQKKIIREIIETLMNVF
jgi:hypothetical protein